MRATPEREIEMARTSGHMRGAANKNFPGPSGAGQSSGGPRGYGGSMPKSTRKTKNASTTVRSGAHKKARISGVKVTAKRSPR